MPAAMSDPLATSVPRLDPTGSNWAIFAMRFQEAMEANQKWKHFTGTPGRPTPPLPTPTRLHRCPSEGSHYG